MGKPAPVIYQEALAMLQLPADEVVAIGDSLEHDIGGAAAAGIASVFVLGGIHADDVMLAPAQQQQQQQLAEAADGDVVAAGGWTFSRQRLAAVCGSMRAAPTFVLSYFT